MGVRLLLACPSLTGIQEWRRLLQAHDGVDLVGETVSPVDTLFQLRNTRAHVVVIDLPSMPNRVPGLVSHILAEMPAASVIAVSADGGMAKAYVSDVVESDLPDGSVSAVLRFIVDRPELIDS